MISFQGKYRVRAEVSNNPEAVFLYKKLQEEDKPFVYTSDISSYQRLQISHTPSENPENRTIIVKLPDNTGDYETLQDAIEKKRKADRGAGGDGDINLTPIDQNIITCAWSFGDTWDFVNLHKISGVSTHPLGNSSDTYSGIYAFVDEGYIAFGISPKLSVNDAIFCYELPETIKGKIGYRLTVNWKKIAFKNINSKNKIYYHNFPADVNPEDSPATNSFQFEDQDGIFFLSPDPVNTDNFSLGCGASVPNEDWYGSGGVLAGGGGKQLVSVAGYSIGGHLIWEGSIDDYPAWVSYMNSMAAFWELPPPVFLRSINAGGCNLGNPDDENSYPPIPEEVVAIPTFKGRFSDIYLNFQKNGVVQELKLPIEFASRVTQVSYDIESYYGFYAPIIGGYQRIEVPCLAEWFVGRVNIDKDYIYVDICYGIYREFETGKTIIPNGDDQEIIEFNTIRYSQSTGTVAQLSPIPPPGLFASIEAANDGAKKAAKPLRDKFKYTRRFIVNKKTFEIISDNLHVGHPLSNGLFTDNFLKNNIVLDIQNTASWEDYYQFAGSQEKPFVILPQQEYVGYMGNPAPYFQLDSGISFFNDIAWESPLETAESFYLEINDFLNNKDNWSSIDWLFWNLLERPYPNPDVDRFVEFETRGSVKGNGISLSSNLFYIASRPGLPPSPNYHYLFKGLFAAHVEYERFRGYPLIEGGNINKWIRLSPYSLPIFDPMREQL